MTEPEMWEAVQRSDASYDGLFFYAVKTTGIFCRPSCKSKPPKRENLCYFASGEEARAAGFRPCKCCRSDLLEYQPMREIAAEIKARLDKASSLDDAAADDGCFQAGIRCDSKGICRLTPAAHSKRNAGRIAGKGDRCCVSGGLFQPCRV